MFPSGLGPGDKMTMSFTKSAKPPTPDYLKPGAAAAGGQPSGQPGMDSGMGGGMGMPMGGPAEPNPAEERAALIRMMMMRRPA